MGRGYYLLIAECSCVYEVDTVRQKDLNQSTWNKELRVHNGVTVMNEWERFYAGNHLRTNLPRTDFMLK